MSYAPLDSDILFSTTIKEGPVVFAVWCAILASKDQDGVTALNPESVVGLMSKPLEGKIADLAQIQAAWDVLAAADPKSHNQEHGGRRIIPVGDGRWLVVSHDRYRLKHLKERRVEQLRDAKRRQREREKAEQGAVPGVPERCDVCGKAAVEAVAGMRFCEKHRPAPPEDEEGPI